MTRRIVCRIVGVLYNTYVWGVTAVKVPEVVVFSPDVAIYLNIFSAPGYYILFLQEQKTGLFDKI